jgi:hypothetical protein
LHQQKTISNIVEKGIDDTPRASLDADVGSVKKLDTLCGIEAEKLLLDQTSLMQHVKGRLDLFTLNVNSIQVDSIST